MKRITNTYGNKLQAKPNPGKSKKKDWESIIRPCRNTLSDLGVLLSDAINMATL